MVRPGRRAGAARPGPPGRTLTLMNVAAEVDPQILAMYRLFDVVGVLLMGVIGGTIARQRGFDLVGFFFIAMFSALGGGMIRDVLINQGTVAALANAEYLVLAFTGALIARFVYFKGTLWDRFQVHGDALISALWAATGAVKAVSYGLPVLACVLMGVFTATGGSMIRDIVTGRIPGVFGGDQPTVIPATVAGATVLISEQFDLLWLGMILGPILSFILSMIGYWAGWRLRVDPEWAPVNRAAPVVRGVARRVEPSRARAWRHRQMERALRRRVEKQQRRGMHPAEAETRAQELLDHITGEPGAAGVDTQDGALPVTHNIGFDLGGDSYDSYDEDTGRDTPTVTPELVEAAEETAGGEEFSQDLIDRILANEKLTDELIARLERKFDERR